MLILIALAAQAATPEPTGTAKVIHEGREIATSPVRDIGAEKITIPPVLEKAAVAPYARTGTQTCPQLKTGIASLTAALGPDFSSTPAGTRNRVGKLAEAGGQSLVNSLIPFRGLVREVSGAGPAERRLAAAVSAGIARRGFLRGVAAAKNCKLG